MYYICGYYIFGWEFATGNVITENVINYFRFSSSRMKLGFTIETKKSFPKRNIDIYGYGKEL